MENPPAPTTPVEAPPLEAPPVPIPPSGTPPPPRAAAPLVESLTTEIKPTLHGDPLAQGLELSLAAQPRFSRSACKTRSIG